jgi:hypothetical protein
MGYWPRNIGYWPRSMGYWPRNMGYLPRNMGCWPFSPFECYILSENTGTESSHIAFGCSVLVSFVRVVCKQWTSVGLHRCQNFLRYVLLFLLL